MIGAAMTYEIHAETVITFVSSATLVGQTSPNPWRECIGRWRTSGASRIAL